MKELNKILKYIRKEDIHLYYFDTGKIVATYIETTTSEYFSLNPNIIKTINDKIIILLLLIFKRLKIKNKPFNIYNRQVIPHNILKLFFKYKIIHIEGLKNGNKK